MDDYILVSAPNVQGEDFIKQLQRRHIPFAAIVNNKTEYERMLVLHVNTIIVINTNDEATWRVPELPIGRIFLFERSLNLCCRYIQICRSWTSKSICVITDSTNPRLIYKGMGANYVIHSGSGETSFLISNDFMTESQNR
ncbi:hypothetical protein SAMN05216378_5456 [Paenibacillus catalpae]|uniref:Uncharacterized protein n=1 Tax=Paenibacillus catalpae TaxID=1045775 RepID=A0A1I2GTP9_9BACL|nr:hypothetical protein [Paenibacillus catalpae]SFF20618.1 hypothetical protein SAMN05216378_5456 [Paenibacillus catalpae]